MIDRTPTHICLTRIGQEGYFARDLDMRASGVKCTQVAPGVVELSGCSASEIATLPPFFSQQLLPDVTAVSSESIRSWAQLLFTALTNEFDENEATPWHLHVFSPTTVERGEIFGRARLITEETLSLLKQKRRSLMKRLVSTPSSSAAIAQLLLLDNTHGYLSFCRPHDRPGLKAAVRPTIAGYEQIADDKAPPSRAFKKLLEAIEVFGLSIRRGAKCVDLGACPGGWTHVLVERGCTVIAVDRSPLAPNLMQNRQVTYIKGDAFTWQPSQPVDVMVCDVIAAPERSVALIDTWLSKRLCSLFCVTVKFKGEPDFNALHELRALLRDKTEWFDGKQLCNNKNELTVVGKSL